MNCTAWPLLALSLLACAARDPKVGDGSSDGGESSSGEADATGAPTSTSTVTYGDPDAGATTGDAAGSTGGADSEAGGADTSSGEVGESTGDTGDTGDTGEQPFCPPMTQSIFDFRIEPGFSKPWSVNLDWECEVLDKILFPAGATLMLACTDAGVPVVPAPQLVLNTSPVVPAVAVEPGDPVHLQYARYDDDWSLEESLRVVAADQTLLVAGYKNGSPFDPFEGVTMGAIDPLCGPEEGGCGLVQHGRLQLTLDGVVGIVASRDHAEIGAYGVWMPIMMSYVDGPNCTDISSSAFHLHLVRQTP